MSACCCDHPSDHSRRSVDLPWCELVPLVPPARACLGKTLGRQSHGQTTARRAVLGATKYSFKILFCFALKLRAAFGASCPVHRSSIQRPLRVALLQAEKR